jgi:hypothetical protein
MKVSAASPRAKVVMSMPWPRLFPGACWSDLVMFKLSPMLAGFESCDLVQKIDIWHGF